MRLDDNETELDFDNSAIDGGTGTAVWHHRQHGMEYYERLK